MELDEALNPPYCFTQEQLVEARAVLAVEARKRQWIPVGERLPEDGGRVLAVYKPRHRQHMRAKLRIIEARYSSGAWRFLSKKFKSNKSECITHWMPLPNPPTGDRR